MPYYQWAPYVSVAERRRKARKKMDQLRKRGQNIQPIEIQGRNIAKTFWGQAWCDHLESLGDFANRLPRGRTYVRNGSVCHLAIGKGIVSAMVNGSSMYKIEIKIDVLPKAKWNQVKRRCAGQIGSLLELLQGKLSGSVMDVVTDHKGGLFPLSKEIRLGCNCPDWAVMCKHVAAALYGVGARLDQQPELLFLLRGVQHKDLVETRTDRAISRATSRSGQRRKLAGADLGDVFGIDLQSDIQSPKTNEKKTAKKKVAKKKKVTIAGKPSKKKPAKKKVLVKVAVRKPTTKKASIKRAAKKRPKPR